MPPNLSIKEYQKIQLNGRSYVKNIEKGDAKRSLAREQGVGRRKREDLRTENGKLKVEN
ncbi:MAG: hypothetical protein J6Z11_07575 [Candidatus Riflebacteria bacterium]|nr:hypothetical protein [Candidatus Riflebacteria bacterium]